MVQLYYTTIPLSFFKSTQEMLGFLLEEMIFMLLFDVETEKRVCQALAALNIDHKFFLTIGTGSTVPAHKPASNPTASTGTVNSFMFKKQNPYKLSKMCRKNVKNLKNCVVSLTSQLDYGTLLLSLQSASVVTPRGKHQLFFFEKKN